MSCYLRWCILILFAIDNAIGYDEEKRLKRSRVAFGKMQKRIGRQPLPVEGVSLKRQRHLVACLMMECNAKGWFANYVGQGLKFCLIFNPQEFDIYVLKVKISAFSAHTAMTIEI